MLMPSDTTMTPASAYSAFADVTPGSDFSTKLLPQYLQGEFLLTVILG